MFYLSLKKCIIVSNRYQNIWRGSEHFLSVVTSEVKGLDYPRPFALILVATSAVLSLSLFSSTLLTIIHFNQSKATFQKMYFQGHVLPLGQ
jgi:hypothetical protein